MSPRGSERVAIWTHYFDEAALRALPDEWPRFPSVTTTVAVGDRQVTLHRRHYEEAVDTKYFCGGPKPHANWMERDDLLHTLRHLGFTDIEIGMDSTDHPFGPNLLLLASKPTP